MTHQKSNNSVAEKVPDSGQMISESNRAVRSKPYEKPELISYGDVRDITLGGTLGLGESGSGFTMFEP